MPDASGSNDDGEWEVAVVKTKRNKKAGAKKGQHQLRGSKNTTGGGGGGGGKTSATSGGFRGWAKPASTPIPITGKSAEVETEDSERPVSSTEEASLAVDKAAPASFLMQPLSALLQDYGYYDPNWMDKQPEEESAEADAPEQKTEEAAVSNRLGQQGKAPLHIDIVSFGFKYGAPSTRRDGWSQSQPLQPFDCRDILLPVPGYLQFHDGISSGQVKRFLLYEYRRHLHQKKDSSDPNSQGNDDDVDSTPSVREYSSDAVAPKIYEALSEAIRTGGYGYALPLKMKFYIGSEWGRHRSVVAAEQTATALRRLLRKTKEGDGLDCPCSVATQHRDIERKIPSKKNDRDDDD